ncbi:MAG TPA: NAD(P)(+) transhydrogenase (Re/Si-specific) subunit beta, partial [Clostridiales bacterium]|nr:NAD(P)(+) transhydrogenase (Re/Si-specific) subunit beta [Clostridiales bacterium]
MNDTLYYVLSALLSVGVLLGIRWMSRVETAVNGNRLSALCMLAAVVMVLVRGGILDDSAIWLGLAAGLVLGVVLAR